MSKTSRPRHGSLQFWPRKRAKRFIPSVNWKPILKTELKEEGILGCLGYKVGMTSVVVKDNTAHSLTKGKKIVIPATILEIPNMKIYSIRFYNKGKILKDFVVSDDKILRKKLKIGKKADINEIEKITDFDDVRVIIYSVTKDLFKKAPDFAELSINAADKVAFVKDLIGKEISAKDMIKWGLVDVRGVTKGKGFQGAVKRFGIKLRAHKSEKGIRKVGSIGPWHPARVTFRVPMPGQMGMFTRVHYNLKVLEKADIKEKDINRKEGYKNYGKLKGNYLIVAGSVQGPSKRQVLVTPAIRPNKKQSKKEYEVLEVKR